MDLINKNIMKLVILTATYNHPENLKDLYTSLKEQKAKSFLWVIINDGSKPETEDAIKRFQEENLLNIKYVYQENAGKSAAINRGLDVTCDSDYVLIVDDDEVLNNDATLIVEDYYARFKGKCTCMNFNRSDYNGIPLTNGQELKDRLMSFQKHKSLKLHADGYVGYYTDAIKNVRFPLVKGEKYMGPSVLMMLASANSTILWAKAVLGKTEYLEGGITKQGRKLRLRNPIGMIYHASLMMHPDSSFRVKYGYSVYAFAYKYYADVREESLKQYGIDMNVFYPVKPLGKLLALYWKRKFV